MKGKFGILIGVIALSAAIYTGVWYHKSNELKESVDIALAERSKNNNYPFQMTYDKIERTGYPFNVEITFTNPKFLLNESQSKIIHTGNLTFGQSLFDKQKIWVKSRGKTEYTPAHTGEKTEKEEGPITFTGNAFLECSNCGNHLQLVNNMLTNTLTIEEWAAILLENSKLELNDFTITQESKDRSDIQQIVKIQDAVLGVQNKIEKGNNNFVIHVDVKKMSPIFTLQTIESLRKIFPNASEEEIKTAFYSCDNSDIILQAHGFVPTKDHPFYQSPSLKNLPPFSLVIDKIDFKNACSIYQSEGKIRFEKPTEKEFKGLISFLYELKVTEKYHSQLIKMGELFASNKQAIKESDIPPDVAQVFKEHANELIPNLTKQGTIKNTIELNFHGHEEANSDNLDYVELNKYKIGSDLYDLNLDGKAEKTNTGNFAGNLDIKLKNYQELFKDILNYYMKWQKYLAQAKAKEQLPIISTQYVEKIEKFLESFSTSSNSNQLEIPIVYDGLTQIKIGKKTLADAINAWSQLLVDLDEEYKKSNPAEMKQ